MKELEGEFICLRENTEKYKTFPVPMTEELTRIGKNGKEITKTKSYRWQFIDRARFMASSLSNLVDNIAQRINKMDMAIKDEVPVWN